MKALETKLLLDGYVATASLALAAAAARPPREAVSQHQFSGELVRDGRCLPRWNADGQGVLRGGLRYVRRHRVLQGAGRRRSVLRSKDPGRSTAVRIDDGHRVRHTAARREADPFASSGPGVDVLQARGRWGGSDSATSDLGPFAADAVRPAACGQRYHDARQRDALVQADALP
eukprot:6375511-Prymnesium_polylepis.1